MNAAAEIPGTLQVTVTGTPSMESINVLDKAEIVRTTRFMVTQASL